MLTDSEPEQILRSCVCQSRTTAIAIHTQAVSFELLKLQKLASNKDLDLKASIDAMAEIQEY